MLDPELSARLLHEDIQRGTRGCRLLRIGIECRHAVQCPLLGIVIEVAGNDERTRLRVVESGHELRDWPDAEKQRYADEHLGGWAEYLDRLAAILAKRQPG